MLVRGGSAKKQDRDPAGGRVRACASRSGSPAQKTGPWLPRCMHVQEKSVMWRDGGPRQRARLLTRVRA
jgi:hypothetical protein